MNHEHHAHQECHHMQPPVAAKIVLGAVCTDDHIVRSMSLTSAAVLVACNSAAYRVSLQPMLPYVNPMELGRTEATLTTACHLIAADTDSTIATILHRVQDPIAVQSMADGLAEVRQNSNAFLESEDVEFYAQRVGLGSGITYEFIAAMTMLLGSETDPDHTAKLTAYLASELVSDEQPSLSTAVMSALAVIPFT